MRILRFKENESVWSPGLLAPGASVVSVWRVLFHVCYGDSRSPHVISCMQVVWIVVSLNKSGFTCSCRRVGGTHWKSIRLHLFSSPWTVQPLCHQLRWRDCENLGCRDKGSGDRALTPSGNVHPESAECFNLPPPCEGMLIIGVHLLDVLEGLSEPCF